MKKIIVAILAFLYLGVSSGIAMDIHYCMGEKAGFDLYGGSNEKCHKCGMKEKKGCCSDENKFYKLNDSHENVSNELSFETPVAILSSYFKPLDILLVDYPLNQKVNNHSPPADNRPSANILHCTFRL